MLVYGDARRTRRTAELLDDVARGGADAFFDAAELAQGLIDAEFEARGEDDLTPLHAAALGPPTALARGEDPGPALRRLRDLPLPDAVSVTTPEGYAFYAVYPQAYRLAARSVRWSSPPLVIGLRSIGTGLASVVAAETGGTALTVRPTGHPFAREVRVSAALRERLAAHAGPFAIVDEGPGLSGSSFGSVGDLLENLGVERARLVFLPSHAGDLGPEASPAHRARWASVRRAVATLDDLIVAEPIAGWFEDLTGPAAVEDLSGGAWRATTPGRPPAHPAMERRKFRLTSSAGTFIARFAGLGRTGEAKLQRARVLHAAGFAPEPLALRRGFLLQRWTDGELLDPTDRPAFLAHLARYLAFRARSFPAGADEGAGAEDLCVIARRNAALELVAPALGDRVHVDGRLHAWEWRRTGEGRFLKLDALDHSCGHDLIGCQPIEWDIAGAAAEFDLNAEEVRQLIETMARHGARQADPAALAFFDRCYAAFQVGLWTLAGVPEQVDRYRARLADLPRAPPEPASAAASRPP